MPILANILENTTQLHNVAISILDKRKQIPRHNGYYKGYLRYHLGISVPRPSKCVIYVNGQSKHWSEGEGFLFDDMFDHQVYNISNNSRIVIYGDVIRRIDNPDLDKINKQILKFVQNSSSLKDLQKKQERSVNL